MARLAVLASGNGSNFQAIVEALRENGGRADAPHECAILVFDRKSAFVSERAARLGVPARHISYFKRDAHEAEAEISRALIEAGADVLALAGFMRILSAAFVADRRGRIVNVHPALLPKWPGAHAIERAYEAGEREFGATVHFVDEGMDTGPVIDRDSFLAEPGETLAEIETRVHAIEHRIYPRAVLALLDSIEAERKAR